jgi:hypothetical protein
MLVVKVVEVAEQDKWITGTSPPNQYPRLLILLYHTPKMDVCKRIKIKEKTLITSEVQSDVKRHCGINFVNYGYK